MISVRNDYMYRFACVNKSVFLFVFNSCSIHEQYKYLYIYTYACICICMYIMYLSLYIFWDTTLVTSPRTTIFANQNQPLIQRSFTMGPRVKRPFHGTLAEAMTAPNLHVTCSIHRVIGSINSHDFPYPDDPWDWNIYWVVVSNIFIFTPTWGMIQFD